MEGTRQHAPMRKALWLAVALAVALAASAGLQAATHEQAFAGQARPKVTLKSPKKVTAQKGETFRVKAKASKGAKVTFKSSRKAVASVSPKGKVRAKKAGRATISVIAKKGKRKAVKKVKVRVVKPRKKAAAKKAAPRADEPQREEPAAGSAQQPAQQDSAGEPDQTGQQGDPKQPGTDGTEDTDPDGLGPVETWTFTYPCYNVADSDEARVLKNNSVCGSIADVHAEITYPDGTIESCDEFLNVQYNGGWTSILFFPEDLSSLTGHGDGDAVCTVTYRFAPWRPADSDPDEPERLGPEETYTANYPCCDIANPDEAGDEWTKRGIGFLVDRKITDVHVEVAYPDGTVESCDELLHVDYPDDYGRASVRFIPNDYGPLTGHGDGYAVCTFTYHRVSNSPAGWWPPEAAITDSYNHDFDPNEPYVGPAPMRLLLDSGF